MLIIFALWSCWQILVLLVFFHLIRASRRGNEGAAILIVIFAGVIVPAMGVGVGKELFGLDLGAFGPHYMELALLFEALLFTLALAYQIRIPRRRELATAARLNAHADTASRHLLDTLDGDRTRLASDLHDSAGQMLGLISSRLKNAALQDRSAEDHRADLNDIAGLASDTLAEIRRISHDLHPATLTHLGLQKALWSLGKATSDAGNLQINCSLDFDPNALSAQQNLQIYRIFQELIANAVRHSGAKTAHLELRSQGNTFLLRFGDDGRAVERGQKHAGIGRDILKQRVRNLGGSIQIEAGDVGTSVCVEFQGNAARQGERS